MHLHVHRLGRVKGVLVHGEVHLGTQPSELGDIVRGPPALRLGEVERVKAMVGRLEVDHRGAVEDGGEDVLIDLVGPLPGEDLHIPLVLLAQHDVVAERWLFGGENEVWMRVGAQKR